MAVGALTAGVAQAIVDDYGLALAYRRGESAHFLPRRVLSALAGQRFGCLGALDAWSAHADDLRALILASRGPADPVAVRLDEPGLTGWAATMQRRRAAVTSVMDGWRGGVRGT